MADSDLTTFLNALKMSGEEAFTASGSRPEASRETAVPLPAWATQAPRQTADQTPSLASGQGGVHQGWAEMQKFREDRDAAVARGGALDPSTWGFKTPGDPNELYGDRMSRDVKARGGEFRSPPAQALPAWAGGQPASQPARAPHPPPQLALGAPIGAVSPVQVNNQALVNALRAPAAPQAIGGNNG